MSDLWSTDVRKVTSPAQRHQVGSADATPHHLIKSLNPEDEIGRHPIAQMQRVLGVKRCLVMLDGLEDIEYQDQQKENTDLFGQFIHSMGSSGLVITTTDGKQVRGQKLHLKPLVEGPALLESLIERQDPNSEELCDA